MRQQGHPLGFHHINAAIANQINTIHIADGLPQDYLVNCRFHLFQIARLPHLIDILDQVVSQYHIVNGSF